MSINATLFAQMVVFALLVWFTMRFVWPVLQKAMQDRETKIADGLAAAERGRHELELAEQRSQQLLREGKDKAQEYLTQAQRRADEIVEEAKVAARVEGERLVTAARAQIDQERIQAREQLRKEVASLAIAAAEQVLSREVDAKVHAETLDRFSAQL